MKTKKIKKCKTCFGFGMWTDGTAPMGPTDAEEGMPTIECPECKANKNPVKKGNKMNKKWLSTLPKNCDVCQKPLGKYFIDGKTNMGPWGILCTECHKEIGCGLGIGRGQVYLTKTGVGVDGFKEE